MRLEAMTELSPSQLAESAVRVAAAIRDMIGPGVGSAVIGLHKPVVMVVILMRTNMTQEMAAELLQPYE